MIKFLRLIVNSPADATLVENTVGSKYVIQKSPNKRSYFGNSSLIWAVLFLVIVGPLSAAQIVIGFVNLDSCQVQPLVPIWLIVSGLFNVGFVIWHVIRIVSKKSTISAYFGFIWCLLAFIWFVMGNYRVFIFC